MPDNVNLHILSIVHTLQSSSQRIRDSLNVLVASNVDDVNITLSPEAVTTISSLLETQSKLLSVLMEHNLQMSEDIEAILRKLQKV